jgi:hypothetical protein
MTIVTCNRMLVNYLATTTPGTISSAALGPLSKIAFNFQPPKEGIINGINWQTGTVVGSPTIDIRLETVGSGGPSGTLFGANTNVITGTLTSNTSVESTLTSGATVTPDNFLWLVWAHNSGTSVQIALASLVSQMQVNYPLISTGGLYSRIAGRLPYAALRYSDGTYWPIAPGGVAYGVGSTTIQYSTGEEGLRFRLLHTARIPGFWSTHDPDVNITYSLYADSTAPNGTPIRRLTVSSNQFFERSAVVSQYNFSSPVVLEKDTWYRLVGAPSGPPGTRFNITTVPVAAYATAIATDHMLTRSSGTSWINTPTILPQIGVVIDGLDDGTGGAGGSYSPIDNILIG